jgi:4-aminobutyrate aminotransferase-like enzyme/Ser/Thr protein kinase RdoA (MazF antagonist)
MNKNYNDLKVTPEQAESIALQLFNVKGVATALVGDVDFNFKIKGEGGYGYILKISRPSQDINYLRYQEELLQFIANSNSAVIAPKMVQDKDGDRISRYVDDHGRERSVRLLTWIPGRLWSSVNPQLNSLRLSLGEQCGQLTAALQGFDHPEARRSTAWDIAGSLWTREQIGLFEEDEREVITYFQDRFETDMEDYYKLRKSVVHNDANDNNILVSSGLSNPEVTALIDYGDAIYTQIINDVAITCAYAIMELNDPLDAALPIVRGYHSSFALKEEELAHLFNAIAMRLIISVTKSAMSKREEPENEYLLISEKPAWELLKKWRQISPDLALYTFREACEFSPHPHQDAFRGWAGQHDFRVSQLFPTIKKDAIHHVDMSVSSTWLGHEKEFNDLELFQFKIDRLQSEHPDNVIAGGYLEPRSIYTTSGYDKIGNNGPESRTIHLGIDFWLPAGTPVHAMLDGEVVMAVNDAGDKEYGGLVVLKHRADDFDFYTLYGHNTVESALQHKAGDIIKKGDKITELGNWPENGNWVPHLHFQMLLSMLDYRVDFPGVAYFNQLNVWKSICPDPNLLFKEEALNPSIKSSNEELIGYRKQHLGKSLILQYDTPINMVRGGGAYLIDRHGKKYLDTVNNVAHVGHEHFDVVKAGRDQMALINTNSRYLHSNMNDFTSELLATLPEQLSVVHLVNSGSEANELAIRMVNVFTGEMDIIASEAGYHGNSNICVDISSYKFDGKGGQGAPEHTHIIPLPDTFRGKYRGNKAGIDYAKEVQYQIDNIHKKGRGLGAFIIEPIISCGGQIELPEGFLAKAYANARGAGGLCISDEVQTGCGRMGKTFWGFQLHDVVPDIVTIGKPIGNGHPLGVVVCTREVAEKFANGMEYFNTFGGNPVSCAIGTEVLRIVKREKLQEHALAVGEFLKSELSRLTEEFPIISHVRGQGLFLGFELTDTRLNPLDAQANYLAKRMKDHGILMSVDGPDYNVLKIKPPLVFNEDHAKALIHYLRKILAEDLMKSYE